MESLLSAKLCRQVLAIDDTQLVSGWPPAAWPGPSNGHHPEGKAFKLWLVLEGEIIPQMPSHLSLFSTSSMYCLVSPHELEKMDCTKQERLFNFHHLGQSFVPGQ